MTEALERLTRDLEGGDLEAARAVVREAMATIAAAHDLDTSRVPGPGSLGQPVAVSAADLAPFVRAIDAGNPARAYGELEVIAGLLDRLAGDEVGRERDPLDAFFESAIDAEGSARIRERLVEIAGAPVPDPSLGYLNYKFWDDGLESEAIFGPRRWLSCRCGRLRGGDHRGERCDDCGVLCDDRPHRSQTWSALYSGVGLIHPAMFGVIADVLGLAVGEVAATARGRDPDSEEDEHPGGPLVLRDALGDRANALLLDAIPVVPPGDRPMLRMVEDNCETEVGHPITDTYRRLLSALCSVDQLIRLDGPEILMHAYAGRAQRALEAVIEAVANPAPTSGFDGWGPRDGSVGSSVGLSYSAEPDIRVEAGAADPDDSPGQVIWLTEVTVAVKRRGFVAIFDRSSESVVDRFHVGEARLQCCDDNGRYLIVSTESGFFEGDVVDGFGCFDLAERRWLEVLPDALPAVTFGKPGEPETGALYELRRKLGVGVEYGDRPTALCWSRGNRYVLACGDYEALYGGGIHSTRSGLIVRHSRDLDLERPNCPVLEESDELEEAMYNLWESRYMEPRPAAIARFAGGWRFLTPQLLVGEDSEALFALGFAIEAASFSPDVRRLMLLGADELVEVDVDARAIAWRRPLSILGG